MAASPHELVTRAAQCWREASRVLGIRVVAPYAFQAQGVSLECLAFLPDFGRPNGMVIGVTMPPEWATDARLIHVARANGLFYSFVNPSGWVEYNEAQFKDALIDWGYFGPPDNRPHWFKTQAQNE